MASTLCLAGEVWLRGQQSVETGAGLGPLAHPSREKAVFPASKNTLSGLQQPVLSTQSARGPPLACAHTGVRERLLPGPSGPPPAYKYFWLVSLHPRWGGPRPQVTSQLCSVPSAAAQRADVGGEAAGTSINHSQMLLHRLQELLRQGNASDVVLRVQATGTDEVRVFHGHRLLLGLHSELFRELLSNQSEVVLQEPRDCAAVFDKFVRYGGEWLGMLRRFPSPWLSTSSP